MLKIQFGCYSVKNSLTLHIFSLNITDKSRLLTLCNVYAKGVAHLVVLQSQARIRHLACQLLTGMVQYIIGRGLSCDGAMFASADPRDTNDATVHTYSWAYEA
jgi:hypothetical protein